MEQFLKRLSTSFLITVAVALSAAGVYAQSSPIRSGDGWAIHAQREAANWTRLVAGRNLAAGKLVPQDDRRRESDRREEAALRADGRDYHLAAARHKRGLDDLSDDAWSLPEDGTPWVHDFQLPVKKQARYVAVQIAHN